MERLQIALALAVTVLVAAVSLAPPRLERPGPPIVSAATPRGRTSSCTGSVEGSASPVGVRGCETSTIGVRFDTACSVCPGGINVVLIQLTAADDHVWMRESAYRLMDELTRWEQRQENPIPVRVGVVHYNHLYGRAKVRLTEWKTSARGAIAQVGPSGGDPTQFQGQVEQAVGATRSMLRDEHRRQKLGDDDRLCDFAVLYGLGSQEYSMFGQRLIGAARALIGDGVVTMVGCPSGDPDACYYPRLAPRERRHYAEPPDRSAFARMLQWEFRDYDKPYTLRELGLTQVLTAGLAYVDGSASVAPADVVTGTTATTLTWRWERLQTRGAHSETYGVMPLVDTARITVEGAVSLWDADGRRGRLPMPGVGITVTGPCWTPTPTSTTTPTPTATPTVTPTPTTTDTPTSTPTSTATPSPTPTPKPVPIYLPLLLGETCGSKHRYADVVLVIDTSSSMTGAKLAAAKEAAKAFLAELALPSDRAAVVAFSYEARLAAPLTGDAYALRAAVDGLAETPGTRIDRGLRIANDLLSARPPGTPSAPLRTGVIVLMTDGQQVEEPHTAVAESERARAAGTVTYYIGLGSDVDGAFLARLAGDPRRYFYSPTPDQLSDIYLQVASEIPCAPSAYWGRR